MQKQAPTLGRLLVATGFALSCFGLMLFLWVSFGGPLPLKPRSYRISAYFPEALQLTPESDVRIGGVSVGRVKEIELAPPDIRVGGRDATEVEIEIEPRFAPIASDARAILRQKTLLGETYVELTSGSEPAAGDAPVALGAAANVSDAEGAGVEAIPEGGTLGLGQTQEATQIDEIFNALDAQTRRSFQELVAEAATSVDGRGADLNQSLGNLGPFLDDAARVTEVVNSQRPAVRTLLRDGAVALEALTRDDRELAGVVTGAERTFGGLAASDDELARSIAVLPTFEREARLTLERLDRLRGDAAPLVRDLLPVADDVSPTLRSVAELAPHLRGFLVGLDPLLDAAARGLPALRDLIAELRPALAELDPFLANLNPVVRFLAAYRNTVAAFISNPPIGISGTLPPTRGQPAPRHFLRVLSYFNAETLAVHRTRLASNRGNGYIGPNAYLSAATTGIFPNFDCRNTDYSETSQDPDEDEVRPFTEPPPDVNGGEQPGYHFATCAIGGDFAPEFGGGRGPALYADP